MHKLVLRMKIAGILSAVIAAAGMGAGAGQRPATLTRQETALDRVVHIEKTLVTDVPEAPRWCDRLALKAHRVDVGGTGLYVEEEGTGPALVLINGGPGGTHHYFHPWFSRAAKFSRVIYYDQRGCGLSDFKPGKAYSVDQAVDDLDAIRRALNANRWVVLGYSYGGFLAQLYALKYPENTAGLVLMSASPGFSTGGSPAGWNDFQSKEEKARLRAIPDEVAAWAKANAIPPERADQVLLYNLDLNGAWKAQHFLKPSPERLAQMARYEWVHDADFNGILNQSAGRYDFQGAFTGCPIPTIVLEGKYDGTWSPDKAVLLLKNHPGASMVVFEHASHPIYEEEPDRFFEVLGGFVRGLAVPAPETLSAFKTAAAKRLAEVKAPADEFLEVYGWSRTSNVNLAKAYRPDWLGKITDPSGFLKVGFALYDVENYAEALAVFERMGAAAHLRGNEPYEAVALIWQGHMLDLLGRRAEAIARYKAAAALNIEDTFTHGQFGMRYAPSAWAAERLKEPFKRIENRSR
jgi:proline iminopeptidase